MKEPPPDFHRLRDRAEKILQKVFASDLGGPLYIVLQSEFGRDAHGSGCALGFVMADLDAVCRSAIGPRWRGPGQAMVIADAKIGEEYGRDDAEHYFHQTAAHEFAHLIDKFPAKQSPGPLVLKEKLVRHVLAGRIELPKDEHPWKDHGVRFIRAACHVSWRLQRAGLRLHPNCLCAGHRYELSPADEYLKALNREPRKLRRLPIAKILRLPLPDAFREIFASDVAAWRQKSNETIDRLQEQLRSADLFTEPADLAALQLREIRLKEDPES